MKRIGYQSLLPLFLASTVAACSDSYGDEPLDTVPRILSFEEYEAQAIRNPDGGYIVEGDIQVADRERLTIAYQHYIEGMQRLLARRAQKDGNSEDVGQLSQSLAVYSGFGSDYIWSRNERKSITYCVSAPDFDASGPDHYARMVSAMHLAASAWASAALVRLVHIADQDWSCNAGNSVVTFNVQPTTNSGFGGIAFYPGEPRQTRAIRIDTLMFQYPQNELEETTLHEVGHTLGFVHEQSRPEGVGCPQREWNYRELTAYDPGSIMHYEQFYCPVGNPDNPTLTALDRDGARQVYGVPNLYFADVTNDNRADAIAVTELGAWVSPSTGSDFPLTYQRATGKSSGMMGTHFVDLTNDGRADLIMVDPTGITVRRTLTTGDFDTAVNWSEDIPFYGARGTYFADLTNDRRAEAIVINDVGPVAVRKSTGSAPFGDIQNWTTAPELGMGVYFADVTADKRADLIRVENGIINVRRANSSGTAFLAAAQWFTGSMNCTRGMYFADVTNDLRADLICVREGAIMVGRAKSTNNGFYALTTWLSSWFYGNRGTHFADVTGDGRADAIAVNDSGVLVRRAQSNFTFGASQTWKSSPFYGTE